jgi:hypothetical protein
MVRGRVGDFVWIRDPSVRLEPDRRDAYFFTRFADQRLFQSFPGFDVTAGETPQVRISLAMRRAASQQNAPISHQQRVDDAPHAGEASDDLVRLQLADLILAQAKPGGQHVLGMLTQSRRRLHPRRLAVDAHRP